jgi:hypothetical protein
MRNLLVE